MVHLLQLALASKEIQPVHPKGDQHWIFTGRTDAQAPIVWPPRVKSQLIGKDLNAGKDCGQEEKGVTEDEMVGWHHQFNGHDFEQAPGDGEGQGSLVCFNLWGHKESDMTEQLNNQDAVHSRRYLQDNGFYFFNSSPSLFYKRTWHPDLDKSAIFSVSCLLK